MRLALLSFWHVHADDYAREALERSDVTLDVAWDDDPARGAAGAARYGLRFEPDLDAILHDSAIDGVIVTSATTAHGDLIRAAASAGKHIFLEKVIAPTLAETDALLDAVAASGVTMMVALNRAVEPATTLALDLLATGEIGAVTGVHVRLAHDGAVATPEHPRGWLPERFFAPAESGGGALIDLGAHPLYVTRLFLGMPDAVSAELGYETGRPAEDTARVTFTTLGGATGLAETGFTSVGADAGYRWSLRGTRGTLSYEQGHGMHLRTEDDAPGEPGRSIEVPRAGPRPFARFVEAVQTGAATAANLSLARDLSALVEAAYASSASGEPVRVGGG